MGHLAAPVAFIADESRIAFAAAAGF